MTLGIFWNGQQAQLNAFKRSDRHLSWIHIAFLFAVSIMPFSTRLLAGFIAYRSVLVAYWANILLLGVVLFVSWRYAEARGSATGGGYATSNNAQWSGESWWPRGSMPSERVSA